MNNRIFIVDDDLLYIHYLKSLLRLHGDFEINTFSCGKECISNLYRNPDLIILDYDLGETNGIDILKSIRDFNKKAKVIMVTTHDETHIIDNAFENGATSFIFKDMNLASNIKKYLSDLSVKSQIA